MMGVQSIRLAERFGQSVRGGWRQCDPAAFALSFTVMKPVHLLFMASAATGLLLTQSAQAQDARTVTLRFRKAGDTTVVIRGAQITIDHTIEAGNTDSLGLIRVPDLDDGGHIVEAVAKGYQAFFDKFVSGANIRMPIDLDILAIEVAAKPKGQPTELTFAGFDARRAKAQGKFFTLAQLKAADGRPLSNLLKVDAGASITSGPRGESFLTTGTGAACYAAVVRDGLRIHPFENGAPPDLDKIFTDDLAGVEFYPRASSVPAELKDVATCGALVLWKR